MSSRSFSPMLKRRAAPAGGGAAARVVGAVRANGPASGIPRFAATPRQAAPAISHRNDHWEGEARRVSETALRPTAPVPRFTSPPVRPIGSRFALTESRALKTGPPIGATLPWQLAATAALPDVGSVGEPLSPALRLRLESLLGADLGAVRIHTGPGAQLFAENVDARAFTVGNHIYLGAGESSADLALIAHETTHAIQQSATLNAAYPCGPPSSGMALSLSAAPRGMIQRNETTDWLLKKGSAVGGAIKSAGGTLVEGAKAAGAFVAEGFWAVVDKFAPQEIVDLLHQIRSEGFLGVLKKKISGALDFVFSTLKAQGGTTAKIATFFETLIAKVKPIMAALAAGDCKPLFAAVKALGDTLGKMAGDAWDKIVTFLTPIGEWLSNVWTKFGAPVVDFLKEFAADAWEWIQGVGKKLWDLTSDVRKFYAGAWTQIKKLLGFGDEADDDGSPGLIGWIKTKAGEVWDGIKETLKPVIEPIKQVAKAIYDILPIKDILNLREKINEWLDKATAMADNMDQPDDTAENQDLLRTSVIPGIKRAILSLRGKVASASVWVTHGIGGLVTKVTDFFGNLSANTILSPFKGAIQWLSDEAVEIGNWATDKVVGLFDHVDRALVTLETWIEPVFEMLKKLFSALGNLMDLLSDLVLGPLLLVPKCIRDPIKDFIVTRILKQIPIFSQLLELPDVWAKVQPAFRAIIVQIFSDGNLFKAAWIFFKTMLSLLGVPPELVTNLIRNAAKAIKDVINDPVGFLGNLLTAMKMGLLQFIDNIGKHLLNGAVDWLLSGVKGPGIKLPQPFAITLRNVLDLVMQVLDLTKEKVFQRIEKKKGKEVADKVRKIVAAGEKMFEWVTILFNEGPAGLWQHLKGELNNLWDKLLGMVIDFLIGKIVQQATIWVTKTLASGGLSVIIDAVKAVYDALQVVAQYLKQMLEVANSVCEGIIDIAKGVLNKAANMVESAAARLIPPVLAFLAKTLGIGDLPVVIGEGIQKVRTTVETAIDNLIEKTFAVIDWAKQKGKEAIDAVLGWLGLKEPVPSKDGKPHSIYVEKKSGKVMVASAPMNLDKAVELITEKDPAKGLEAAACRTRAENCTTQLEALQPHTTAGNKPSGAKGQIDTLTDKLRGELRIMAQLLGETVFAGETLTDVPPAEIEPNNENSASTIKARYLTDKTPKGTTPPKGDSSMVPGWYFLRNAPNNLTVSGVRWVQLHLISEQFGGPGVASNLVPASNSSNMNALGSIENPVKTILAAKSPAKGKAVLWYRATASYFSQAPSSNKFFIHWRTKTQNKDLQGNEVKASMFPKNVLFEWGLYNRSTDTAGKLQLAQQTTPIGNFNLGPLDLPDL